ncbi:hypothetical protein PQQ63_35780 [Paraburkholderia metrosideri]|uniref:Uncharacterized protein n=1 Tax=Paraburkholderia metrosideri TaxID=580937 RepID=A0ABW9E537_9BURK
MALIAEALRDPAAIFRKLRRVFECISSPLFILIANASEDHAHGAQWSTGVTALAPEAAFAPACTGVPPLLELEEEDEGESPPHAVKHKKIIPTTHHAGTATRIRSRDDEVK